QLFSGKALVTFSGAKGLQTITADNGAVVTIDSSVSITGLTGTGRIVSGAVFGGTGSFVNNGTIAGTLTISVAGRFTNAGTVQSAGGATLTTAGLITNFDSGTLTGGAWRVSSDSAIDFQPGPITTNAAAITLDGSSSSFAALSSLTANSGTLTLTG